MSQRHSLLRKLASLADTFSMRSGHLDALDIELPRSVRKRFYDDGIQESLEEHRRKLDRKYGTSPSYDIDDVQSVRKRRKIEGYCTPYRVFLRTSTHVFYRPQRTTAENILVRGHEETHALSHFNWLHLLQSRLNQSGVPVDISNLEEEVRADVGGLYAVAKQGLTEELTENWHGDDLEVAVDAYNQAADREVFNLKPPRPIWFSGLQRSLGERGLAIDLTGLDNTTVHFIRALHQQEAGLDPRLRWGYKLPENPVHAKSLRTAIELYNKEIGTERFKLVA